MDLTLELMLLVKITKFQGYSGMDKNVKFVLMNFVIVAPIWDVIVVLKDILYSPSKKMKFPELNVINVLIMLKNVVSTE